MLKNRYQEILVGMGLMSLVRGMVSLRRNRSTLLIDDRRFRAESYFMNFVSELELLALERLGRTFDIPELVDVRSFTTPGAIDFVTDQWRLVLGGSPFENLRELLRKFPDLVDDADVPVIFGEDPGAFNEAFFQELARFELQSFQQSQRPKPLRFDLQGPKWLKTLYANFGQKLNLEYTVSKDLSFQSLLHLFGLSAEEKIKTRLSPEEVPFYFFRMLSPVYRLQDFLLTTQLKRRLEILGGDTKESSVQYWQLFNHKFENLLLESFEGVISGERVLFFSHFPEEVPFGIHSPYPVLRKTQFSPVKKAPSPFPPRSMTFITGREALGSMAPFRVLARGEALAYYHWPYPELSGSKPEFYFDELRETLEADALSVPFDRGNGEPHGTLSVSLDLRSDRLLRKNEAPVLTLLPMPIREADKNIQGFEYWGPFRYKSFGLLALCYGVEGI